MNKPVKTKLCWNCEGSVTRTAENCPFCGVYLSPESIDPKELQEESTPVAPYKPDKKQKGKDIPKAPYSPPSSAPVETSQDEVAAMALPVISGVQSILFPVVALTTGLLFLFFAVLLALFSSNGKLTLEWDATFWYVYALIGVPLLFLGWKFLDNVQDNS